MSTDVTEYAKDLIFQFEYGRKDFEVMELGAMVDKNKGITLAHYMASKGHVFAAGSPCLTWVTKDGLTVAQVMQSYTTS